MTADGVDLGSTDEKGWLEVRLEVAPSSLGFEYHGWVPDRESQASLPDFLSGDEYCVVGVQLTPAR